VGRDVVTIGRDVGAGALGVFKEGKPTPVVARIRSWVNGIGFSLAGSRLMSSQVWLPLDN